VSRVQVRTMGCERVGRTTGARPSFNGALLLSSGSPGDVSTATITLGAPPFQIGTSPLGGSSNRRLQRRPPSGPMGDSSAVGIADLIQRAG
jgi:hypothetical protein